MIAWLVNTLAKVKSVRLRWLVLFGEFPHGSKNGNLTKPPIRDSSSIGRALQREGILLLNTLGFGSSPNYPTINPMGGSRCSIL